MRGRSRFVAVVVLAVAAACSDSVSPVPGSLTVSFTTPNNGQDEALLLVVQSPTAPANVQAMGGLALWTSGASRTQDTLALTGTLTTGAVLTLAVGDVNQVSHYHVQVLQVAAAGTHALRALAGYSLGISK